VVVAAVREGEAAGSDQRGGQLAALRALQMGCGLWGQWLLLARWSPHAQTDAFLVLSAVPWLLLALLLVGGLDMALPAAYHRATRHGEKSRGKLVAQVLALTLAGAVVASLAGGIVVTVAGRRLGLSPGSGAVSGASLGALALPSALVVLGRGLLVARDRLLAARGIAQSALTAAGYALAPGSPGIALPLVTLGAAAGAALATLYLVRGDLISVWEELAGLFQNASTDETEGKPVHALKSLLAPRSMRRALHPEVPRLVAGLLSLGAAAALLHAQGLIERAAVQTLGEGEVAAFAGAARLWDAALALVVAGGVMPLYPRWARGEGTEVDRAMRRTLALTLTTAALGGGMALVVQARLGGAWPAGAQALRWTLLLLPRFVLLGALQPLILRHYAQGTPWVPVAGSALGALVLLAAPALVSRWGHAGMGAAAAASVLPGWLVLGLRAGRKAPRCAS
jgi:hypothetical protein